MKLGCRRLVTFAAAMSAVFAAVSASRGFELLGAGTDALLGQTAGPDGEPAVDGVFGDLTDIGNDGVPGSYQALPIVSGVGWLGGFDGEFFTNDETGFGGGEFAFNVFNNSVGGGNNKWCCGEAEFPIIVGAELVRDTDLAPIPHRLTKFTVTSGNDAPDREPRVWTLDGSNDGVNWTTIYERNDPSASVWDQSDQVALFSAGSDFPVQTEAYSQFRLSVTATNAASGAFFQLNELEFFGVAGDDLPPLGDINGDGVVDTGDYEVIRDNYGIESTPGAISEGNVNGNFDVDIRDFNIWKNAAAGAIASNAAVPEPAAASLAAVVAVVFASLRRRKQGKAPIG